MESFAKAHPDFPAVATFYIPRNAFEGNGSTPGKTLRWLVEHGFELGNHTRDHIPFNTIDATEVQRQLVLGDHVLSDRIPRLHGAHDGAPARGATHPALAGRPAGTGTASPTSSTVSSSMAPSRRRPPFSKKFTPGAIPRIRPNPYWDGSRDFTGGMWFDILEKNPVALRLRRRPGEDHLLEDEGERARRAVPLAGESLLGA